MQGKGPTAAGDYWVTFIITAGFMFFLCFVWAEVMAMQGFFNLTPDSTFTQLASAALLPFVFPGLVIAHVAGTTQANRRSK